MGPCHHCERPSLPPASRTSRTPASCNSHPVAAGGRRHDQKLERADLDTAIEVAAGHPVARTATVEVRPFWDAPWDRLRRHVKLNRVPGRGGPCTALRRVAEDTADAPHR
jgi:hypothetical protein